MIKGKDNLLKWVRSNDSAYWKVFPYGSGKNNYIFTSSDEPNLSLDQSIQKLSECLELLESGRYTVACKQTPTQSKALSEIAYEHNNGVATTTNQPETSHHQVSGISQSFEERLQSELNKFRQELKVQEMQKEIDRLKQELSEAKGSNLEATFNRVLNRVDPYLDPVLDHFFPQAEKTAKVAAIGFSSQTNENQKTETMPTTNQKYSAPQAKAKDSEEASQRCRIAMQSWMDADEDFFLYVVEKIAHTAVNDPNTYQMYRSMLLK